MTKGKHPYVLNVMSEYSLIVLWQRLHRHTCVVAEVMTFSIGQDIHFWLRSFHRPTSKRLFLACKCSMTMISDVTRYLEYLGSERETGQESHEIHFFFPHGHIIGNVQHKFSPSAFLLTWMAVLFRARCLLIFNSKILFFVSALKRQISWVFKGLALKT